jgi:hypothetical protein
VWCSVWGTGWILKYYLDELWLNCLNYFTFIKEKIKIPPSLCHVFSTYHRKFFTFTVSLSVGRAGTAWEPSINEMLFSLPDIKRLSLLPQNVLLFCYPSWFALRSLSMFLMLKRFNSVFGSKLMNGNYLRIVSVFFEKVPTLKLCAMIHEVPICLHLFRV